MTGAHQLALPGVIAEQAIEWVWGEDAEGDDRRDLRAHHRDAGRGRRRARARGRRRLRRRDARRAGGTPRPFSRQLPRPGSSPSIATSGGGGGAREARAVRGPGRDRSEPTSVAVREKLAGARRRARPRHLRRPRGELAPARRPRARNELPPRGADRHADGSVLGRDRARAHRAARRRRAGGRHLPVRRRAPLAPHRAQHQAGPRRRRAPHDARPPARHRPRGRPGPRRRGRSRDAHVPGAPDRGEPRARGARDAPRRAPGDRRARAGSPRS